LAGCGIDLQNGGALLLFAETVLTGIAVRSDGHVEARSVAARDQILRPVMIERSRRQIGDLDACCRDLGLAFPAT